MGTASRHELMPGRAQPANPDPVEIDCARSLTTVVHTHGRTIELLVQLLWTPSSTTTSTIRRSRIRRPPDPRTRIGADRHDAQCSRSRDESGGTVRGARFRRFAPAEYACGECLEREADGRLTTGRQVADDLVREPLCGNATNRSTGRDERRTLGVTLAPGRPPRVAPALGD